MHVHAFDYLDNTDIKRNLIKIQTVIHSHMLFTNDIQISIQKCGWCAVISNAIEPHDFN